MRWIGLDQGGGQSWNAPNPRPLIETSCCSPTIITCTSEFKLTYIPPPPTPKKQNAMSPRGHRRPLSSTIRASHAGVRALPVFHVESQPTCFPCIWDYVQLLFNSYSFVDAGEINGKSPGKSITGKSLLKKRQSQVFLERPTSPKPSFPIIFKYKVKKAW